MKWLNSLPISAEIEAKLNERIQNYLDENTGNDGAADPTQAKKLIQDLHLLILRESDPVQIEILTKRFSALAVNWDSEDPQMAHIQKYFNRLFSGKEQLATDYIDRSINLKIASDAAFAKQTKSDIAKKNADLKNQKTNQAKEAALNYYNKNRMAFKTKKEAARELESKFPPITYQTYYRILRNK